MTFANPSAPTGRMRYRHFLSIATRWKDNDIYGHVNNVEYYSYFDTVINSYLIGQGGLQISSGPVIGVCAESHCRFLSQISFPETVDAGLRVEHLGRSSVRYGIGLFRSGEEAAAAEGWFVHVFVDRATRRSTAIPAQLRDALERLLVEVKG
jgi:acyl-CoA thioester hydrolase